jgi:hypothetical protein
MTPSATILVRKQSFSIVASDAQQAMAYRTQMTDAWLQQYSHLLGQMANALPIEAAQKLYIPKLQLTVAAHHSHLADARWMAELVQKLGQRLREALSNLPTNAEAFTNPAPLPVHARVAANTLGANALSQNEVPFNDDLNTTALRQYLSLGQLPTWCRHTGFSPKDWLQHQLNANHSAATIQWCFQLLSTAHPALRQAMVQRLLGLLQPRQLIALGTQFVQLAGLSNRGFFEPLLGWFCAQPLPAAQSRHFHTVLLRAIIQLEAHWWQTAIEHATEVDTQLVPENATGHAERQQWLNKLVAMAKKQGDYALNSTITVLVQTAADPANGRPHHQTASAATQQHHAAPIINSEEIYSRQAGLVLLHPFLPTLFSNCGLLSHQQQFQSLAAQHTAVLLLRYLCNGISQDWDLALEKKCCGLRPTDYVAVETALTPEQSAAADALLQAILGHWPPLNQSSASALQETFLQRSGKLQTTDPQNWQLYVERSGVDILLEQLPWTFSTIKWPWLKPIINVLW